LVFEVAVVAGFLALKDPIATAGSFTEVAAGIVIDSVTVVTVFEETSDPVAALGQSAGIGAAILIDTIAVITIFKAFIFRIEVFSHHAIATAGEGTVIGAGISIASIAVITGFILLNNAIATASRATIMTGIIRLIIAIIATLTGANDSVSANVEGAIGFTGV